MIIWTMKYNWKQAKTVDCLLMLLEDNFTISEKDLEKQIIIISGSPRCFTHAWTRGYFL